MGGNGSGRQGGSHTVERTNSVIAFDEGAAFRNHPLIASARAAGENRNVFEAFVRGFIGDLRPVGAVEATLAARAAGVAWRLNRAQGLETQILAARDGAQKSPLENGLSGYRVCEKVETVARWEQGLERSLFKTLDALDKAQRLRRKRGNNVEAGENGDEKSNAAAIARKSVAKEIEFDSETAICDEE